MSKEKENPKKTDTGAKAKRTERTRKSVPAGVHKAVPIVLAAMAVFTAVCFIMDGVGELGGFLADFLLGLFSYGAYGVPVLLLIHALFYTSDVKGGRLLSRVIFSVIALVAVSTAIFTVQNFGTSPEFLGFGYYEAGISGSGGGLIGSLIAYGMTKLFGFVGVIIIAVATLAIYITYFFSGGGRTLKRIGFNILRVTVTFCAFIERKLKGFFSFVFGIGKRGRNRRSDEKSRELYEDDFFAVDNGIESLEISELGIAERRSRATIEARPTLHDKVFHKNEVPREASGKENGSIYGSTEADSVRKHGGVWNGEVYEKEDTVGGAADRAVAFDAASADAVFTKDFDPFDIAMSEELANKPSSKCEKKETPSVTERLDDVSDVDAEREKERERQREEFERRRAALAERARREAVPVSNTGEYTGEKKTFEFTETKTESVAAEEETEAFTVKFKKSEDTGPERYRSEYIESTYGDTPYYTESDESVTFEKKAEEPPRATEEYVSGFRDYRVSDGEDGEAVFELHEDTESEAKTLTVERTYISDLDEDGEYEEDDDGEIYPTSEDGEDGEVSSEEIPKEEQNPAISDYRDMFTMFRRDADGQTSEGADKDSILDEPVETYEADTEEAAEESLPFERAEVPVATEPRAETARETKPRAKDPYAGYVMPPLDLLGIDKVQDDGEISAEIRQNTQTLIETLASFNVTASIKGVDRGPRITRYEVVPARGVKVNAITNLFDDIALNLAAEGIRMEAPIPGKSAIGFEIPNKKPSNVRLRELLECEEFVNAKSKTFVCIGKDVAGNPVFGDIAKFPHALVAGATGMGKSVCINSIMISMLYKARPDEVKFIMIDPKKVEFRMYSGIPHLLIPVITEAKQAAGALMWAVEEMERRYSIIEQLNIRNIEAYNERCATDRSLEPMPKIVIVIDELNDLMMQVRDPVEDLIMRIAQKARAAGIHLIIGTQRPDVKVVTGTIKANINTRISCKVTSVVDSRTILEMAGAEKLLNRGDMLFKPVDKTKPIRVQGCFVSDPEVEAIMDFLKANNEGNVYNEEVFAEINRAAQKCGNKKSQAGADDFDGGDDEVGYYNDQQFLDAVELAIRSGKISTSLLQRKLSIGYGKAAKYIDSMEEIGIVSEQNGQKPRDVLISMDEWHEKLTRVNFDE